MSNLNPAESTAKKRRNLPGNPDPEAEVIALSPKSLMATNRFMCEVCSKGFQRDQNLQLHRRGHNLPWKLKQRPSKELIRKKVYVCPEPSCVHHCPSRALGDLTGIKKHFSRKHGEKKYRCDKCSKKYAVQSDCRAHSKSCGTREYACDCGTIFSRRDSFVTHRAFCDALTEEGAKPINSNPHPGLLPLPTKTADFQLPDDHRPALMRPSDDHMNDLIWAHDQTSYLPLIPSSYNQNSSLQVSFSPHLSATALLQKAAELGATMSRPSSSSSSSSFYITTQMAPHTTSSTTTAAATHSPLLQEMLRTVSENNKNNSNAIMAMDQEGRMDEDQELTRDFLGLRALSHKDIFSINIAAAPGLDLDPAACMRPSQQNERYMG